MTETNIVVPQCALDALEVWRADHGLRRDPAVRQLLDDYVESQRRLDPQQRLTHVSTVIWHPEMPVGRRQVAPHAVRLRLRLHPGVADAARALAMRLPGQIDGRGGYHDYRPRLLADAFLTALAAAAEFSDEVLDGLPPVLTHGEAVGLFRLAAAASSTSAERRIYARADRDLDKVQSSTAGAARTDEGTDHAIAVATLLRDEDIAWHGPWRRAVTRHLVRKWLTGPDAESVLAAAAAQDAVGFGSQRQLLEQDREHQRDELEGLRRWYGDSEGRGGTAIWRAERLIETRQIPRWLADSRSPGSGRSWATSEPGWTLRLPESWHTVTVRHGDDDRLRPHLALAEARRVIHASAGGTHIFWPYVSSAGGRLEPVPAMATVLRVISDRDPAEIIELVLAPEWCPGIDIGPIELSAFAAHELGFIDLDERDELVKQAQVATCDRMQMFLDAVPGGQVELQRRLTDAMSSPAEFARIVAGAGYQRVVPSLQAARFFETHARVRWPLSFVSLAAEVDAGLAEPRLRWLCQHLERRYERVMALAMDRAWRRALQGYRSTTTALIDGL
jgi:hypothetical protein